MLGRGLGSRYIAVALLTISPIIEFFVIRHHTTIIVLFKGAMHHAAHCAVR